MSTFETELERIKAEDEATSNAAFVLLFAALCGVLLFAMVWVTR